MNTNIGESLYNIRQLSKVLILSTLAGLMAGTAKRGGQKKPKSQAARTGGGDGDALLGAARRKPLKVNRQAILLIILAVCIAPSYGLFGVIAWQFIGAAMEFNLTHILIGLYLSVAALISLTFGLYHIIGAFYLSGDAENLLPLPFRPYEILLAKFISVLAFEAMAQVFFLLPALIVYGLRAGTPAYWIYAAIFYFAFPIVPLTIASLFAFLLKPVIKSIRNTDTLSMVLSFIIVIAACSISFLSSRASELVGLPQAQIMKMLTDGDAAAFGFISRIIPTTRLAALAFARSGQISGFLNFLLFLCVSAVFMAALALSGRILFADGIVSVGGKSNNRKKKAFSADLVLTRGGGSSILAQYVMKEFRILFRTPAYLLNCISAIFFAPAILMVSLTPAALGGNGIEGLGSITGFLQSGMRAEGSLRMFIPYILSVGYSAGLFFGGLCPIAATAVSREGKDFELNKHVPIKFAHILWGKLIPYIIMGIFVLLMISAYLAAIIKIPPSFLFAALPMAAAGVLTHGFAGILLDFAAPKLNWENETAAVKRNMNVMINLVISYFIGILLLILSFRFFSSMGTLAATAAIVAVAAALTAASWLLAARYAGPRLFRSI